MAKKPPVKRIEAIKLKAIVEAIDFSRRIVTLRKPEGYLLDLHVGEEARNLDQVRVGDKVVITTDYESVALRVKKSGKEIKLASQTIERASPGESPGGVLVSEIIATATIEQINPKRSYVTLKGPQGNVVVLRVLDPANLKNLEIGDEVEVTYTQNVAIEVEIP